MHYVKFIKYESGGYGFANKWVIGKFSHKISKTMFMKDYANAISLTEEEFNHQKDFYTDKSKNVDMKEIEIHTLNYEKTGLVTKQITVLKPQDDEEELCTPAD
ncbi:MAG: hypothetical protein LRY57_01305 [Alphaproteobacteria bacterium]|nr:hypothetical protein [Alphaproteobacteria bacterium]